MSGEVTLGVSTLVLQTLLDTILDKFEDGKHVTCKDIVVEIIKPATATLASSYLGKIKKDVRGSIREPNFFGKANAFVSHAWKANGIHLLETLIRHGEEQDEQGGAPAYFWLDICCNNQHEIDQAGGDSKMTWEWWTTSFMTLICACSKVLIVASPFTNPDVCQRAWCLFEAATAKLHNVPITVCVPPAEESSLLPIIAQENDVIIRVMTNIDSSKAESTVPEDLRNIRGMIAQIDGQFEAVDEIFKSVLRHWITEKGQQLCAQFEAGSESHAKFSCRIGTILQGTCDYEGALAFYKRALATQRSLLPPNNSTIAVTCNNIAHAYDCLDEHELALQYYNEALQHHIQIHGVNDMETAKTYNNIAQVHCAMGEYDRAIEVHEQALAVKLNVLGTKNASTAISYNNIGSIYAARGEHAKALEYYTKSLDIKLQVLGDEHVSTATSYNNIGDIYRCQSNYVAAIEYCSKALAIRRKLFGDNHIQTATTINNIALAYEAQGRTEQALEMYLQSLEIFEQLFGTSPHLVDRSAWTTLAGCHRETYNRVEMPVKWHQRSLSKIFFVGGVIRFETVHAHDVTGCVLGWYYSRYMCTESPTFLTPV
eukprot:m.216440 g.216440  ORF g.216440 m.216440 type:complete len:598 (-) comp19115_c0_seq16:4173-5966(-)